MRRPFCLLNRGLAVVALATAALLAGCGDNTTTTSSTPTEPTGAERPDPTPPVSPAPERLDPPPCPTGSSNCAEASGEIIYVERVDPDGDGDAHFVLASADGITGPGISVIDVSVDLRPHPLPEPGDQLAASGPVYRGSYGQRQIQATEVRSAPAGRSGAAG